MKEDFNSTVELNISNIYKAVLIISPHNLFDVKSSLKIDVYISSYLVYSSAQNIDTLSTERFFTFKKERFITTYSW